MIWYRVQSPGNQDYQLIRKTKEQMKATWSEIKHNTQETNSDGKETGTQINDLEQKKEINIQLEQNEATRIQKKKKMSRGLGTYGPALNIPIFEL